MVLPTPTATTLRRPTEATVTLEMAGTRRTFRLLHPTRIGASPSSHIKLGGQNIRPHHATIEWRAGAWSVETAADADPVELNGIPVRSATLTEGDRLAIAGFQIEFHFASSAPKPVPKTPLPKDPVAPNRAALEGLAKRLAVLDQERASFRAEQEAWLLRLAVEKKQIDRDKAFSRTRLGALEDSTKLARINVETELKQGRLHLDARAREIEQKGTAVDAERAKLAEERRSFDAHRRAVLQQLESQDAARHRAQKANARWHHQLQREKNELDKRQGQLKEREERLLQSQARAQHQLEVHAHELTGLQRRIDNERMILADLKRRQQSLVALKPVALGGKETPQARDLAELEGLAGHVERLLISLERTAGDLELADRRLAEERKRLAHFARHLDAEERRLAQSSLHDVQRQINELADKERVFEERLARLQAGEQALDAERARWKLERSAWEEVKAAEGASLKQQFDQLRAKRVRVLHQYREKRATLRREHHRLAHEQSRIASRVGQMMRQEAHLQIVIQELEHARLALVELEAQKILRDDPLSLETAAVREMSIEHRHWCEKRWAQFEARMQQTLSAIETQLIVPRAASPSLENETERLRSALAHLHLEQERQQGEWSEERRQHLGQIASLRDEVESLAASLIHLPGQRRAS